MLKEIPPLPGEESLYRSFEAVLEAAMKSPEIKATLTQTAIAMENDLMASLLQFGNNGRPVGNGWTSPPNGARWGFDYLSRAATARSNMYDNAPEETRYIYTDFDSDGHRDLGGGESGIRTPIPAVESVTDSTMPVLPSMPAMPSRLAPDWTGSVLRPCHGQCRGGPC